MKRLFFPVFVALLTPFTACDSQTAPTAGASKKVPVSLNCEQLNGRQYTITITTGGKVDGTEVFSFYDKTVESSECLKYGFAASGYSCAPATDGSLQFATTMTSEKEGRMDWKGNVTEKHINGSFVWSKTGQADIHYTFEGTPK